MARSHLPNVSRNKSGKQEMFPKGRGWRLRGDFPVKWWDAFLWRWGHPEVTSSPSSPAYTVNTYPLSHGILDP